MEKMDSEKLKVILGLFIKFIEKTGCSEATFNLSESGEVYHYGDAKFYCGGVGNISPPFNVNHVIEQLVEPYLVGELSDGTEIYEYDVIIEPNSDVKLIGRGTSYRTEEPESIEEDDLNPEIFQGLPDETFYVDFSGGGDSGYIEDYGYIPQVATDIKISEELNDVLYKLLENFGGWEINEGSQGQFEITPSEKKIELTFSWNTEETIEETIEEWNFAD